MRLMSVEPSLATPPWCLALGLAASFYALPLSPAIILASACGTCGLGLALFPLCGRAFRPRARLVLAFGLGLVAGLCLRIDEGGLPVPWPDAARSPAAASEPREDRGTPTLAFEPCGVSGRLAADSSPLRKGNRFYDLEVEEMVLAAPGMSARVEARGGMRVMAREGPALVAGSLLIIDSGVLLPSGKGGTGLFVAERRGLSTMPPPGFLARLRSRLRASFIAALDLAGGGGASSGLLEALLSGSRDELDAGEAAAFKQAGCAHILSLSGQHLSILAAAAALVLKPLGGPLRAKAISLALIVVFVFVAGTEPALLRSVIMYALASLAIFVDRPQGGRTILGLAFTIQTFADPGSARGLSFILSYLALAGLVVLSPRFERLFLPILPPKASAALAASCAAQAATAPYCAFVFCALYPAGIPASIATGPLVVAFIWWGMAAALVCGIFPAAALALAPVSLLLHDALALTMGFFASWPSLPLSGGATMMTAASVVLGAAFVYALPHAEHALGLRRARLAPRLHGSRGPGNVQALGPEFPGEPQGPRADP